MRQNGPLLDPRGDEQGRNADAQTVELEVEVGISYTWKGGGGRREISVLTKPTCPRLG